MSRLLALALALASSAHAAPPPATSGVQGRPTPQPALTEEQFLQGLARLRKYLEDRGEDPAAVQAFTADIQRQTLKQEREGRPFPVARDAFEAFLKYEAAWARKTRDAKNPQVSPEQEAKEKARAAALKKAFLDAAGKDSPALAKAYLSAVRRAKARAAAAHPQEPPSAGALFSGQVDDSYTQVDAGDEALDAGDAAAAVAAANAALAENPANADALVLKAGAELAQGDAAAAVADAQQALTLDPGNAQAGALVSLGAGSTDAAAGAATLAQASAVSDNLAAGAVAAAPQDPAAAVTIAPSAPPRAGAAQANPTPSLSSSLSSQLTAQAGRTAALDPGAAAKQLGQALSLDPQNGAALNWTASLANRGGDYQAARSAADAALAVDPHDAHAWFAKGQALAGEKDLAGAASALREAARLDPTYVTDAEAASAAAASGAPAPRFADPWLSAQPSLFARRHRRKKTSWPAIPPAAAAGFGALLLAFGVAQVFRSHRAA